MQYRALGQTGLTVSEIGMGCEGFVDKPYEQVKELSGGRRGALSRGAGHQIADPQRR